MAASLRSQSSSSSSSLGLAAERAPTVASTSVSLGTDKVATAVIVLW
jgi:hypothetical protein